MQLLLCAATEFELQPTRLFIEQNKLSDKVQILITGVGLTSSVYQLTKTLLQQKPSVVVQAGVAGSFDNTLPLGSVAVIEKETLGDNGVEEEGTFKTLFDLNLLNENEAPWQQKKLVNAYTSLLQITGLPVTDAVTVHQITTDKNRIDYYKNSLEASLESMEGAALHYVALCQNIPFLQLRSVSNFVGERDKKLWMMSKAIDTLNTEVQQLIFKLI
jgi:futalosine hydrolase